MDVLKRNNVTISGQGSQAMVFAHGFGCDQQMWRFVAPAFEATHRVVLFDHVGCGGADVRAYDEQRHGTLDGYAQDVLEILRAAELTEVIFVGHSVSAMIGVLAAVAEPQRFSRLVLVAPSPRYLNDAPGYVGGFERADIDGLLDLMENNMLGWADFLAPAVMGPQSSPDMTQELKQSFCAGDPYIARRFAMVTFMGDNRADLARVRVPALVLQSSDDAIAPVSVGHYVHQQMPGSVLAIIEANGHCPHMTHAPQTIAQMREFLGMA